MTSDATRWVHRLFGKMGRRESRWFEVMTNGVIGFRGEDMFHSAGIIFGDIGRNAERLEKNGQQFVMVHNFKGVRPSGVCQLDISIGALRDVSEFLQLADSMDDGRCLDIQGGSDIANPGRFAFADNHGDALQIILQAH